ncbi:MAG: excinuclease ATPase subunit [Rhodocyclaceae bacterium]
MKKLHFAVAAAAALLAFGAQARDTTLHLSIAETLSMPEAKEKLDPSVTFYWGAQKTPKVLEKLSTDTTNKKTNAFNKSDEEACKWAFLSAVIALQDKAKALGANAVINTVSYYKKVEYSSPTEFECHAGAIIGGVALKGTYAKVAR